VKEVQLKTKNRVITKFANGMRLTDISVEEKIPLETVKDIIDEWEKGYITIGITPEISSEVIQLANLMRDKEIFINDLIEGYHFYTIFKGNDDERIVPIVKAISSMDKEAREKFLNTAQKMISFSKYAKIDYVDIPKALDDMVLKGKEIQRELRKRELQLQESQAKLDEFNREINTLNEKISKLNKEVEFAEKLRSEIHLEDEEKMLKLVSGLKAIDFDPRRVVEIGDALSSISSRGFSVDQFLKVLRFFEELMDLGLTVQTMQRILDDVKKYEVSVDEYLNERALYVKDKIAYMKSLKELVDAHRRAEKEIRNINEELDRKKAKLEREG